METATPAELHDIIERVRAWEPASRALLERKILDTLVSPADTKPLISDPPHLLPPEQLFGLLKTTEPAPSDAELRAIVAEEHMRKHL